MDAEGEKRMHDTLADISGGINDLKVQVGKVETEAIATKNYCESISDRVKELDKSGTRLCETNKTNVTNLEKRADKTDRRVEKVEKRPSQNSGVRKPLYWGSGAAAVVVAFFEGLRILLSGKGS